MMNVNFISNLGGVANLDIFALCCFFYFLTFQSGGYEEDLCSDFIGDSGHL